MKHITLIFITLIGICLHPFAQSAPPGIPYQAEVRNESGAALVNANVNVRFTLHELTSNGSVSYQETQALTTNELGLFAAIIGFGNAVQGTFATINWAQTTKFLQVDVDAGSGWITMGNQQLMSVPYAMYAGAVSNPNSTSVLSSGNCYSCPTEISSVSAAVMDYPSSFQHCSNLSENGHSDWRVPTLSEFEYARDVLNLSVPAMPCWTKDYSLGGSVGQFIYVYYTSTLRNIGITYNVVVQWNTVCVR